MNKLLAHALGWGFALWLIGYILGVALFFVVPPSLLGWVIMPVGAAITLFVLLKKIDGSVQHFALIAVAWTVLAAALDYIFIVKLLNPADGYYKLDVFVYYALTFIMPIAVGIWKNRKKA
ncbi:MAG TPA: hypothetical protein VLD37_04460 [Candidatus Bilamarchaeum sp.]|nr:hypothetical protein [Candidatus Bilamarchaeum sp.]